MSPLSDVAAARGPGTLCNQGTPPGGTRFQDAPVVDAVEASVGKSHQYAVVLDKDYSGESVRKLLPANKEAAMRVIGPRNN